MNFTDRTLLKAIVKASCFLPIALAPCAALAQDASSQNDAGAALGNLFKSFVQAVQKADSDVDKVLTRPQVKRVTPTPHSTNISQNMKNDPANSSNEYSTSFSEDSPTSLNNNPIFTHDQWDPIYKLQYADDPFVSKEFESTSIDPNLKSRALSFELNQKKIENGTSKDKDEILDNQNSKIYFQWVSDAQKACENSNNGRCYAREMAEILIPKATQFFNYCLSRKTITCKILNAKISKQLVWYSNYSTLGSNIKLEIDAFSALAEAGDTLAYTQLAEIYGRRVSPNDQIDVNDVDRTGSVAYFVDNEKALSYYLLLMKSGYAYCGSMSKFLDNYPGDKLIKSKRQLAYMLACSRNYKDKRLELWSDDQTPTMNLNAGEVASRKKQFEENISYVVNSISYAKSEIAEKNNMFNKLSKIEQSIVTREGVKKVGQCSGVWFTLSSRDKSNVDKLVNLTKVREYFKNIGDGDKLDEWFRVGVEQAKNYRNIPTLTQMCSSIFQL